jgi:putative tryptophan/tyrosine transport system substrate-binding protein
MRRRDFLRVASSALVARPLAVQAQQAKKKWRIGVIQPADPDLDAFQDELRRLGYVEGDNLVLEVRWAGGNNDRFADLIRELVAIKVDALKTFSTPAALAARHATTTIPVVFTAVGDPVGAGVVPSLARPGGNLTGISLLATELASKRLEILREIAPDASPLAMIWNDTNPGMVLRAKQTEQAAASLGVAIQSFGVHDLTTLKPAFGAMVSGRTAAMVTLIDPFTSEHRQQIVDFAAEQHLPAVYESRVFVEAGGLVSYGPDLLAIERRAAQMMDKILRGTKPADIPVEQPEKFELVVNLKTAKTLGLTMPASVLARADEVIE